MTLIETKCTNCHGRGTVATKFDPEWTCPSCHGTGIGYEFGEPPPAYDKTEVPL